MYCSFSDFIKSGKKSSAKVGFEARIFKISHSFINIIPVELFNSNKKWSIVTPLVIQYIIHRPKID